MICTLERMVKTMKIRIVSAVLAACLLFGTPLQLSAAQALPAGGITTTVSDGRYIDSDWMNQALILTCQGQSWAMGLNLLGDYPVFLSDDSGVRQCVIGDSAVIDVFLSAINEQLAVRNRRARRIWKVVAGVLIVCLLLTILTIILNMAAFRSFTTEPELTVGVQEVLPET